MLLAFNFVNFVVISEVNNTQEENSENGCTPSISTESSYPSNEAPLQRDEVKGTLNEKESNRNICK